MLFFKSKGFSSNKNYSLLLNELIISAVLVFILGVNVSAQNRYSDFVANKEIRTVKLHPLGEPLLPPLIELNSADKLILSFDDLNDDASDYSYKVIHCNAKWEASNLVAAEYLEGFQNAPVQDFENSINTLQSYSHYRVQFPNDDMKPKFSGNYVIVVYKTDEPDQIVLSRRFRVYEKQVAIRAEVVRPATLNLKEKSQELRFEVLHPNFTINDPHRDLKVYVEQNQRADNALTKLKPLFVRQNRIEYNNDSKQIFEGGSEFRRFNVQNIRYQTMEVKTIRYQAPLMHFDLKRVVSRHEMAYSYDQDLNGNFLVSLEGSDESHIEADYVRVHFSLESVDLLERGGVYIFGALSDWKLKSEFKMEYNEKNVCYEADVLLKQGFYNYQFVFFDEKDQKLNSNLFEGSHYETENDYYIYIYHYDWDADYDRLIGYRFINSVRKL